MDIRTRQQCETEILAARHAYLEAVQAGDDTSADLEATVIDELLSEYLQGFPHPRTPSH